MTITPQGFPQISAPFVDIKTGNLNQAWYQLLISLWNRTGGGGGVSGSVISFSASAHDGIIANVTDPTTTPNLDLQLGDITPASVAAVGTVTGTNISGTNTGDVTLLGSGSYLELTGQVLTKALISPADLTFTPVATDAANVFTVAPQTIEIDMMVNEGLVIKGASGQTAALADFEDNSSNSLSIIDANGNFATTAIGVGIQIYEGTNARMGSATLSGGTIMVSNTSVTAVTRIFLTPDGGTLTHVGAPYVSARSAGSSFTISSTNALDVSDIAWLLVEPTFTFESLAFVRASSKSLSMAAADYGTGYSKTKVSFNIWVKKNLNAANQGLFYLINAGGSLFQVSFDSSNHLQFEVGNAGAIGALITTATYVSTSDWYNILVNYDSGNATTAHRMRLYVNGVEETSFGTASYPSLNADFTGGVASTTTFIGTSNTGGSFFDGLIYQPAFFDNVVIDPSQVYLAGKPLSVTGISGLYSLSETNSIDALTKDFVLSAAWTNNNAVAKNAQTP